MIWITDSISTVQVEQSIKRMSKQFKTNEMMIYFSVIDTVLMNSIDSTLLKDNYAMFQYSIIYFAQSIPCISVKGYHYFPTILSLQN